MGQLKALEEEYPLIDSNFLEFCASRGIFTVEDFLIHDLNALLSLAEIQPTSERLKQGIDQLITAVDCLHKPWMNGVALVAESQQNKQTLSLMYDEYILRDNSFMHEALREGFVVELVGPSTSGKTQVCLQAAASIAKCHVGEVVFFDTGNSFSAKRVSQLVHRASSSTLQLESSLKNKMQTGQCSLRLLIVDSFSSVIIPILGGNGPYGHALMNSTGSLLKKIADEYNVCVLVTNHMVSAESGELKPALGESWKSIPHVRLLLSLDREGNTCNISVLKHPSKAAHSHTRITIYNT